MTAFTPYDGSTTKEDLVASILAPNSGVAVDPTSIVLTTSGDGAVSYYDGSLGSLGIGAGVLLTSGTVPGETNTVGWFGADNSVTSGFNNGDANIDAVVNTVFSTASYDATTLQLDFTVTDPNATSISFDVVFGSDEYPEWVDQFVDCAVVIVNGVNYALFNHDPNAPLSVIGSNLAAGYFQNNSGNVLQIEYDGVSQVLKIVAPIIVGAVNTIKIGIADTGDHIYDSGLFISNLAAGTLPGSGVLTDTASFDDADNTATGTPCSEIFDMLGGDDTVYAAGGDDVIVSGAGADVVYGGSGDDVIEGDAGDDVINGGDGIDTAVFICASSEYTITTIAGGFSITDMAPGLGDEGRDTFVDVELLKFSNGVFELQVDGTLVDVTWGSGSTGNSAGTAVIDGISAPSNTLTAHVSDANGLSGDITYSWQLSTDGGQNWSEVGTGASHVIDSAYVGALIAFSASYIDDALHPETAFSAPKMILSPANGDLNVTLLVLDAPAGATVMTPFTTLITVATDLGMSPNEAEIAIKAVLGIPAEISLLNYDAYAELIASPNNTTALKVELIAVEIAILTSLSDDDHGYNLALDIIALAQVNGTLDLANADDVAQLLGAAPGNATLNEILDRNQSMATDIADGKLVDALEKEWQDFLSIQDGVASTSIADLSIALNSAPAGYANAELATGNAGTDYILTADELLTGFADSDGDTLSVGEINADIGSVVDNNDGTFTLSFDAGFSGPVEISYTVEDGSGGVTEAKQLVIVAAAAPPPSPSGPVITSGGGGDLASLSMAENGAEVTTVTATHNDPGAIITFAIAGGVDAGLFQINETTGALSFISAPDYEIPADIDHNNSYSVAVSATSAQMSDTQNIIITVTNQSPETLTGTPENDLFLATNEKELFIGNGGTDTVSYVLASSGVAVSLIAPTGAKGFAQEDTFSTIANLAGSAYADQLTGDIENNLLDGGAGNDTLNGGDGDDTLDGGAGNDVLTGGAGTDTASYASASGAVTVSLALGTAQNTGGAGTDTLTTIENLLGSGFADSLTGSATSNRIDGGGGNDTISGGAGADTLLGGDGNDLFVVGVAGDFAAGEVVTGGDGTDELRFTSTTASTLTLTSSVSVERVVIGTGTVGAAVSTATTAINVNASAVSDAVTLIGNAGTNALTGGAGNDSLDGGAGNDSLVGGYGDDSLTGGAGNDTFTVASGIDSIKDLSGGDILMVSAGATANGTVSAAWTATVGTVNSGTATLTSAGFAVNLAAVTGGNRGFSVTNTGAATTLTGSKWADSLAGGSGNDTLVGGLGNDSLTGGAGNDRFTVASGSDSISDLSGADILTVASGATALATVTSAWSATSGTTNAGTATLTSNGFAVNLAAVTGGSRGYSVANTGAATSLTGSKFADTLTGGTGADTLVGGSGADSLVGGDGDDLFIVSLAADLAKGEVITGGDGTDELRFTTSAASTLTLTSGVSVERVVIGTGTVGAAVSTATTAINVTAAAVTTGLTIVGNAGVNTLTGGSGNDSLEGGAGNDKLIGGGGADTLAGGLGNDNLTGGLGADVFVFNTTPNASSNKDTITDFNATDDAIWLAKSVMAGLGGTAGALGADAFWGGAGITASHDATDRVLYNQTTGALYYDADGNGSTAAIQLAQFTAGTALTVADVFIF